MYPELKIVQTADGSNTIYNSAVGENYHSRNGALQESRHVFLNAGLNYYLENRIKVSPAGGDSEGAVSILEVGFGTGLNFLLSADHCTQAHIGLDYLGIEAYPLSKEMIAETGYGQYASAAVWDSFIRQYLYALYQTEPINAYCQLQIVHNELKNFDSEKQYDVVYFDAFASAHQPEMWDEGAISHTVKFLKTHGVFVTYAITGNLKRMLKSLGLKVEKLPGAPGKREMLRAVKQG